VKEFILIFLFIFISSCGKSSEEEVISAKREAAHYLSEGECSKALSALRSASPSSDDQVYISLLASVYECRADYRELTTVLSNLDALDADTTNLFKTMAAFESSQEVAAPDDTKYVNILKAINIISTSSSVAGSLQRVEKFGKYGGSNLNYQLLLLTTIGLSKYFGAYGNVDATGGKGESGGGVVCLAQYNYGNVAGYLDALTDDNCDSSTQADNQTSIDIVDPDYVRRMCEGVVLYNNFLDLLMNLVLPEDTTELGNLVDVASVLASFKSSAIVYFGASGDSASITTYENIRDLSSCESTANANVTNKNHLEAYFSVFLEGNHNR
jgi:hypothetical protein